MTGPHRGALNTRLSDVRSALAERDLARVWRLADPDAGADDTVLWDYLSAHMGTAWCIHRLDAPPAPCTRASMRAFVDALGPAPDLRGAVLPGGVLAYAVLRDARLEGADLSGADLRHADLRGAQLVGADLSGAKLAYAAYDSATRWPAGFDPSAHTLLGPGHPERPSQLLPFDAPPNGPRLLPGRYGTALARLNLAHGDLSRADLRGVDLRGARLGHADLRGALLDDARFEGAWYDEGTRWPEGFDPTCLGALGPGAQHHGASFDGADLSGACLVGAVFTRCAFQGARLDGADLSQVVADEAELSNASLIGASLRGAGLSGARLHNADLSEATLDRCVLKRAYLRGANLTRASLTDTDLSHSELLGVTLDHARFERVRCEGAHFRPFYSPHRQTILASATFASCVLSGWSFSGMRLVEVRFEDVVLDACNMIGAHFERCVFKRVRFVGCDMWRADMRFCPHEGVVVDDTCRGGGIWR